MTEIPDVLNVKDSGYNLLMENEKVRVMKMRLNPGQESPMHNHPHDHIIYVLNDAEFKLTYPDKTSSEFKLKKEQVLWIKAGPHKTRNIGTTEGHNLVTEIKNQK